jgi:hypothetical protein
MESFEKAIKEHNLRQQLNVETNWNEPVEIVKARSGIYKPTKENLKQGRAGERYGNMINGGSGQIMEEGAFKKEEKYSLKNLTTSLKDIKFPDIQSHNSKLSKGSIISFARRGKDVKIKVLGVEKTEYAGNRYSVEILSSNSGEYEKGKKYTLSASDMKHRSAGGGDSIASFTENVNKKINPLGFSAVNDGGSLSIYPRISTPGGRKNAGTAVGQITSDGFKPWSFAQQSINFAKQYLKEKSIESIYKAFDNDLLSKDVFEKAGKAQIGETRTWNGVQMKKVSSTGNSKQDWQPVKQGEQKQGEQSGGREEGELSEEDLKEHAKQSSEQALSNAIKSSPDPTIRQVAHAELQRRSKEEKPGDSKGEFPSKEFMGDGEQKKEVKEKKKPVEKKEKEESKKESGKKQDSMFDLAAKVYDKLDFKDIQNEKKIGSVLKELGYPNHALMVGIVKRHLKEGSEVKPVEKSIQGIRYF